uniref:Uncharacterized protein n=1 Tax=Cacopsylla melanoneura TaxID=428564 RepID=A0A8D9B1K4_9HEMI
MRDPLIVHSSVRFVGNRNKQADKYVLEATEVRTNRRRQTDFEKRVSNIFPLAEDSVIRCRISHRTTSLSVRAACSSCDSRKHRKNVDSSVDYSPGETGTEQCCIRRTICRV